MHFPGFPPCPLSSIPSFQFRPANKGSVRHLAAFHGGSDGYTLLGAAPLMDKMIGTKMRTIAKMKVHPGMLMKTKKNEFSQSGIGDRVRGRGSLAMEL